MKTDGTVVQKFTAPGEAGFKQANEWRVTGFAPGPDGSIYIAELQARVTIVDKSTVPVAFIGDNPQQSQWANYPPSPDNIPTRFSVQRMGAI